MVQVGRWYSKQQEDASKIVDPTFQGVRPAPDLGFTAARTTGVTLTHQRINMPGPVTGMVCCSTLSIPALTAGITNIVGTCFIVPARVRLLALSWYIRVATGTTCTMRFVRYNTGGGTPGAVNMLSSDVALQTYPYGCITKDPVGGTGNMYILSQYSTNAISEECAATEPCLPMPTAAGIGTHRFWWGLTFPSVAVGGGAFTNLTVAWWYYPISHTVEPGTWGSPAHAGLVYETEAATEYIL